MMMKTMKKQKLQLQTKCNDVAKSEKTKISSLRGSVMKWQIANLDIFVMLLASLDGMINLTVWLTNAHANVHKNISVRPKMRTSAYKNNIEYYFFSTYRDEKWGIKSTPLYLPLISGNCYLKNSFARILSF